MPKFKLSQTMPFGAVRSHATRETNEVDRFVGERIRLYRSMLGISQQNLAETLGITFQQLQKYERGENRIGAGRLFIVANTLCIPIADLLDQKAFLHRQDSERCSQSDSPETLREGYTIGRAFSQIADPEIRRSISTLVQSLASK